MRPASAMFLVSVKRKPGRARDAGFPWSLPLFRDLDALRFSAPITLLVGENGSGKSALLEALAVGLGATAVGERDLARDDTLAPAREFAEAFFFGRSRHPKVKLFLRAEDVFGFTRRVQGIMGDLRGLEERFRASFADGSYARRLAVGSAVTQRRELAASYGDDPHARSHGETFLALLDRRLQPNGLYFLDEPETPLSPLRVLALMALLRERAATGCQFVIATHSPMLMALPEAEIWLLDGGGIRTVAFDEVEHVRVMRAFLNDPANFLHRL